MSKIQNALVSAGGEFARPTKYSVILNVPNGVSSIGPNIDILCKGVTIPEIAMEPIELTYKGHTVKYPGRVNQSQTVTCTFYLDEQYASREMFTDWIAKMDNRYYGGQTSKDPTQFYGQMIVFAKDYNETRTVKTYTFENIYPISVGELEYNTADKDNIMEVAITFAYYRYKNDNGFGGSMDGFDGLDSWLDNFGQSAIGGAVNDILGGNRGGLGNLFGGGINIAGGIKDWLGNVGGGLIRDGINSGLKRLGDLF